VYGKWGSGSFFVSKADKGLIPSHRGFMVYLFPTRLTYMTKLVASRMRFN
jgi:hypothetical protein